MELGAVVGPYVVVRSLGQGAMGAVLLGEHQQLPGVQHALKFLPRELAADPVLIERFRREMSAMANLGAHPHIVGVHSEGYTAEGTLYFAMDYIEGRSLRQAMRLRISWREGAQALLDVAAALSHAHARGVVHRDVKPANVLIDSKGRGHLADFGLVHLRQAGARLTHSEEFLGTPAYMAPEQIQGEVCPQSDVYSLGVMLYELLAGRLPFAGSSMIEILSRASTDRVTPVSTYVEGLDPRLDAICLRALSRDLSTRFATADAFAAALRDVLESTQAPASPPGSGGRLLRMGLVGALGCAVLAAGLLGGWVWLQDRATRAEFAERIKVLGQRSGRAHTIEDLEALLEDLESSRYPGLLEELRAQEPSLREAAFGSAWEQGDVARAARAIGRTPAFAHPMLGWVLVAGRGDYARARSTPEWAALPAEVRATLAAWCGDQQGCEVALSAAGPLGAVLAERLRRYLPGLVEPEIELDDAWAATREAAAELARGRPLLAELALDRGGGGEADLDQARTWIEFELAVVELDLETAEQRAGELLAHAKGTVQRGLTLAALAEFHPLLPTLDLGGQALKGCPQLPPVAAAISRGILGERSQVAGASALARARATTQAGEPVDLSWAGTAARSFCEAELSLCAAGWDGPAGLILARGALGARAARSGEPRHDLLARFVAQLNQVQRLRPESPALHLALAEAALRVGNAAAAAVAASTACDLAPAAPLPRLAAAQAAAAAALSPRAAARYLIVLENGAPPPPVSLGGAGADFARALALAQAQGLTAIENRVRLAWANALLLRAWAGPPDPQLETLLEPLVPDTLERFRPARIALAEALISGDADALRVAERGVIELAASLRPEHVEALRVIALAGSPSAPVAAQAVLATGDALAARLRAVAAARAAKRVHSPAAYPPLPPAEFAAFTHTPPTDEAGWARLGAALAYSADDLPRVVGALTQRGVTAPAKTPQTGPQAIGYAVRVAARGYREHEVVLALRALADARTQLDTPAPAAVATALLVAGALQRDRLPALATEHALRTLELAEVWLGSRLCIPALRLCLLGDSADLPDYDAVAAAGGPAALEALIKQRWVPESVDYRAALSSSFLDLLPTYAFAGWEDSFHPSAAIRQLEVAMRLTSAIGESTGRSVSRGLLAGHPLYSKRSLQELISTVGTPEADLSRLVERTRNYPEPWASRLQTMSKTVQPEEGRRAAIQDLAERDCFGRRTRLATDWGSVDWLGAQPNARTRPWTPERWRGAALRLFEGPWELSLACDSHDPGGLEPGLGHPISAARLALENPGHYRGALWLVNACRLEDPFEAVLASQRVVYLGRGWTYTSVLAYATNLLRHAAFSDTATAATRSTLLSGALGIVRAASFEGESLPIVPALTAQLALDHAGYAEPGPSRDAWLERARTEFDRELSSQRVALQASEFDLHTSLRRLRLGLVLGRLNDASAESERFQSMAKSFRDISRPKLFMLIETALTIHQADPWRKTIEAQPVWTETMDYVNMRLLPR